MICSRIALYGLVVSTSLTLTLSLVARGGSDSPTQDEPAIARPKAVHPTSTNASLQSINDDYARQLLALERQRLSASSSWPRGKHPRRLQRPTKSCFA